MQGELFRLIRVRDQACDKIDQKVGDTAMAEVPKGVIVEGEEAGDVVMVGFLRTENLPQAGGFLLSSGYS